MQEKDDPKAPQATLGAEQSHKTDTAPVAEDWLSPRRQNAQRKADQKQQRLKAALRSNLRRRKETTGPAD